MISHQELPAPISAMRWGLLLAASLVLAPTGLAQEAAGDRAAPIRIAVTRSGFQVECVGEVARGDLEVETAFGSFRTPTDPVQLVMQSALRPGWRVSLTDPLEPSLSAWIGDFDASGRITELLEIAAAVLERDREEELALLLPALDRWGALLDRVPRGIASEERVDWLWSQVLGSPGPEALLFGGRLVVEVMEGGNAIGPRQISITTLKRALRSESAVVQRTAARVAERQILDEPYTSAKMLYLSLRGERMVRDACARAVAALWPEHARESWTQAMLRGEEEDRLLAVRHLTALLPEQSTKPLAFLLSAYGRTAPARFRYAGKSVQVVQGTQDPESVLNMDMAPSTGGRANHTPSDSIENVSVVKVTRISPELAAEVCAALAILEGGISERTPAEWALYLEGRFD